MRCGLISILFAGLFGTFLSFAEEPLGSLPQQYLGLYLQLNTAEHLKQKNQYAPALEAFQDCYTRLEKMRAEDPNWEEALLLHRLADCKAEIIDLQARLAGSAVTTAAPSLQASQASSFAFVSPAKTRRTVYPWKTNINTTVFWIGEGSAKSSAWNTNWLQSNNGVDSPQYRNGYSPAGHAPTVSPFYVALPFNDLTFPKKAREYLPPGWQRDTRNGKPISSC